MNYALLLPEFVLAGSALTVLAADLVVGQQRKHLLAYLGAAGFVATLLATWTVWGESEALYGGLLLVDDYAVFFKFFFSLLGALILLASVDFARSHLRHVGEYFSLVMLAALAMMLMASAGELVTAYVSLELLSFSFYALASFAKFERKSNEAGIKYILLGAFSSGLLLYGISIIYGLTGTTDFGAIGNALGAAGDLQPGLLLGTVLVIAGLGFKVAAVPFHMWTPDVYEGAPVPVTAYLAAASKAAGLALLLRLFAVALMPIMDDWRMIIAAIAGASMVLGNLVAIWQRNIKRMLAYSSIGQVGYLLLGVAALSPMATQAIVLHLAGYAASNLAAFACVIYYYNLTGKEDIEDYAGLAQRAPFLALAMTIALFSLAGLPFFAGFATKFYLFIAAAQEGFLWLAGVAVAASLVSLYYYLMVVKQMYIVDPEDERRLKVPLLGNGVVAALLVPVILIGVYPRPLLDVIKQATALLFP